MVVLPSAKVSEVYRLLPFMKMAFVTQIDISFDKNNESKALFHINTNDGF